MFETRFPLDMKNIIFKGKQKDFTNILAFFLLLYLSEKRVHKSEEFLRIKFLIASKKNF
jgi:hypothetical protein